MELEKSAELVLPGSKGEGGYGGSGVQRGEMTQTMYAHVNE
jgi:hypothetical protein